MIELVEDKTSWDSLLSQCVLYDFYHTYDYHQLSETTFPFKLVKFTQGDSMILFPIIIREISGTSYVDITSAYGYAGPVANKKAEDIDEAVIKNFQQSLLNLFKEMEAVTAFSRLHTLMNQEYFFNDFGKITGLNQTVFIDMTLPPEVQRAQYGSSTKTQVNKLKRLGYTVRRAESDHDIDSFKDIYEMTMDRLQAKKEYYFSKDYYKRLLSADGFNTFILLAEFEGKVVAASMFTVCNQFMQYHLSGTHNDFLRATPMKLLLEEARLAANELTLQKFNLGGGYSGVNDSLFEFKSSFSKNTAQYKVWSHILDTGIYDQLVAEKFGSHVPQVNYFPLYRFN